MNQPRHTHTNTAAPSTAATPVTRPAAMPLAAHQSHSISNRRSTWTRSLLFVGVLAWLLCGSMLGVAAAQDNAPVDAAEIQRIMTEAEPTEPTADAPTGIDMMSLMLSGGRFMIPIIIMSLVVVALAVERMLSLRREKVIPEEFVRRLEEIAEPIELFDPQSAFQVCANHPSPAASTIGAMLSRTGEPLGQIETAAGETVARQADRYASPVRWLTLAAAATPLMGLLGTVWGMIVAFHDSTSLSADRSRSEQLSEGIYTALVTTLAGLAVAIPAAILAQYLENRIAKLFSEIEQLAFDLAPGLRRFVGRNRLNSRGELVTDTNSVTPPRDPTAPPLAPPRVSPNDQAQAQDTATNEPPARAS